MKGNLSQRPQAYQTHAVSYVSQSKGNVDVRPLKLLVFAQFPKDSAIYDVLLAEKDSLDVSEFLVKVDIWLKLLRRINH